MKFLVHDPSLELWEAAEEGLPRRKEEVSDGNHHILSGGIEEGVADVTVPDLGAADFRNVERVLAVGADPTQIDGRGGLQFDLQQLASHVGKFAVVRKSGAAEILTNQAVKVCTPPALLILAAIRKANPHQGPQPTEDCTDGKDASGHGNADRRKAANIRVGLYRWLEVLSIGVGDKFSALTSANELRLILGGYRAGGIEI